MDLHDAVLSRCDGLAPATVLDIGCGTGALLARAARRWPDAKLIGVDPGLGVLDAASTAVPSAILHHACAEELPINAGAIDLVVSTTSFGHWADQVTGLREVARVLADGGRCHLAELRPARLFQRVFFRLPAFRSPEEMRVLVTTAGLVCDESTLVRKDIVLTVASKVTPT
ncbi:class I SAM-dependent methyltransferase [Lentzea flava]|uniref:Methyltransferase domain-containing protein n=1 Tax=Lentzea flava TaxID=103732 RepID=A0ABQ2UEV1_9PSEU|nr:class I SAM-dependent methyltransferase [Lentzea flava]GGU27445.1 hypothetical protein GCM10010178_19570 [Lentzea flava]